LQWSIGIDLGGTNIKAAAVDALGQPICRLRVSTLVDQGVDQVLDQMGDLIKKLCHQVQFGSPVGIGMGVPGTIDKDLGMVILAPNLNWQEIPLRDLIAKKFALQVVLENDAQAAALGEYWAGAGKGVQHLLMITIGTGIGSGLILNGRLYHGHTGRGPELGHTKLLSGQGYCGCGNTGCLETLTSGSAMVKAMIEAEMETGNKMKKLSPRVVIERAAAGHPEAGKAVNNVINYLGTTIANISLVLDLDLILIGGGVAEAGEYLIAPLREKVVRAMSPYRPPRVAKGILGNWAGAIGAARLAFTDPVGGILETYKK
jgi:glucokinase